MKSKRLRFTAFVAAVAAALAVTTAGPAQAAQQAPPPQGLGALLGSILDPIRGVKKAPPATPMAAPAPPPPAAPAPAVQAGPPPAPPGAPSPLAIEQQLEALRYFVGPVDGVIDGTTLSAVMAFQKVHGMERTGELNDQVGAAILGASGFPSPLVSNMDANKVEIDLTRQVLFLYEGGSLSKIFPVSSGTRSTPTPTGSYRIYNRVQGWETSPLGRLYNSQYFVGGYAIHGSLSVPNYPASHGCVRLTMAAADYFPDHVGIGTPVYVQGQGS
jgi:peptidoglycan hydrolase-like protein with peptidoglycan-binding domain